MPGHPWLEALRGDLVDRGLPPDYAARFVQELDDHIRDILQEEEERMHTEMPEAAPRPDFAVSVADRLGPPEVLAEQAVAEYRRTTFAGRHPVWMFVVAPMPALVLGWFLFVVAGALGFEGVAYLLTGGREVAETEVPLALRRALYAYFYSSAFVPPALLALWWCRLARRSGRGLRWGLAACLLIALAAGSFITQLTPPTPDAKGTFMIGFGIGRRASPLQVAQFAVPFLAAAGYLLWRGRAVKVFTPAAENG
jgi:hypothetical protein